MNFAILTLIIVVSIILAGVIAWFLQPENTNFRAVVFVLLYSPFSRVQLLVYLGTTHVVFFCNHLLSLITWPLSLLTRCCVPDPGVKYPLTVNPDSGFGEGNNVVLVIRNQIV